MAGVLHHLGVSLPKRLLGASRGNELGHWEPLRLVRLNDQLLSEGKSRWDDWRSFDLSALGDRYSYFRDTISEDIDVDFGDTSLFVLKDPRLCRLLPLYSEIASLNSVDLRCIIMYRDPAEVASSLAARNGFTSDFAKVVCARHVLDAEVNTRNLKRVFVSFDSLIKDFRTTCAKISASLDIHWPVSIDVAAAEIERFLSPKHKHHNTPENHTFVDGEVGDFLRRVFAGVDKLSEDPNDESAMGILSLLRSELDGSQNVFVDVTFNEFILREKNSTRESGRLTKQLKEIQHLLSVERESKSNLLKQIDLSELRGAQMEKACKAAEARLVATDRRLHAILNSRSWRVTRPLRRLSRLLGLISRGTNLEGDTRS